MSFAVNVLFFGGLIFGSPEKFTDLALECRPLAGAKAEPVVMPAATAYLVEGEDGCRLEDRYAADGLWRTDAIRARWRDSSGNRFSICRIAKPYPAAPEGGNYTRKEYVSRTERAELGAKDLDALDEAVYMLLPLDLEVTERVKPRRSQRQNLAALWEYATTNANASVFAFRPRTERGVRSDWYLVTSVSDDPEAAEKTDAWLDEVRPLKTDRPCGPPRGASETELLARDYRRSVVNYSDWHFVSASNVVVVDNMSAVSRTGFLSVLTNTLPRMQAGFRRVLPSPLSEDLHIAALRIFDTREEYVSYVGAGMEWSAALWSPRHRELVLRTPPDGMETLLRTVWHEALHQYLDYACSMIQSPAWFNEGHAVLFEHARFDMDDEIVFDPMPGAVPAIKRDLVEIADFLPTFFAMDYPEFYSGSDEERILKYRIAWSVAYFLQIGAPEVRFQPFRNLRSDLMRALIRTRDRGEAVKTVMTDRTVADLTGEWLSFWKRFTP